MSKVLTERREHIWIITINRADQMNCVDGETAVLLEQAWKRFRDDDELYVAILTGAGDTSFCSGADLKNMTTLGPGPGSSLHARRRFVTSGPGYMGYSRQTDIFKPILCAVNGYAFAGGLELACLGDMRIASENAEFWVACRRWNVPLVDGGTQRLPRIIGMGWAMELIVLGKRIDAREAYRMGLANEVVPRGQALSRSIEVAQQICAYPQGAIRTDKEAALRGFGRPLEEGLRIECEVGQTAIFSSDTIEGPLAFAQKRAGKFTNE